MAENCTRFEPIITCACRVPTADEPLLAGVDEAGRGALVGNVVAAAVVLNPKHHIAGLNDSKKLSKTKREHLFAEICAHAFAYSIACANSQEIDAINILQASLLAMRRAVEALQQRCQLQQVLIDGLHTPILNLPAKAIVGGDALEPSISAASILAKVARDRQMLELDQQYPQYGFVQHQGYPTKAHLAALDKFGVLSCHRKSYAPVAKRMGSL